MSQKIMVLTTKDGSAGSGRMFIWKETWKVFLDNWAFGVGPDNLIYSDIRMPGGGLRLADKAHNIYLEMLATMGIFTFLSFIAFISFFLRKWKNEEGFMYFNMILAYLIQGFFNIDTLMVLPIFWIILGFSMSNMESLRE